MFDFFENMFDTVVDWVTGDAGGAIVKSAMDGAITGVIIGAAAAAIRGDDILQGALKGGAYGGITGGVLGTLSNLSGDIKADAKIDTAPEEYKMSDSILGNKGVTPTTDMGTQAQTSGGILSQTNVPTPNPETQPKPWYRSDEGIKAISSGLSGAAQGAGNFLAAGERADAEKELLNQKAQIERDKIAANTPGQTFATQISNITTPLNKGTDTWWHRHLRPEVARPEVN